MDARLQVVGGNASKGSVKLNLPTVIGRGRDAGLTIGHPMVSRKHCEIFEEDGLLMVRDLGSTNGTMIQGRPIEVAPLLPGAKFSIGPLMFSVEYAFEGDPDNVPPIRFADEDLGADEDQTEIEPIEEAVQHREATEFVPTDETVENTPSRWAAEVPRARAGGAKHPGLMEWDAPNGDSGLPGIEEVAGRAAAEAAEDEEEPEPAPPPNLEEMRRTKAIRTTVTEPSATPTAVTPEPPPPPIKAPPAPAPPLTPPAAPTVDATESADIDDFLSGLQ
jgi:hypothetical protein